MVGAAGSAITRCISRSPSSFQPISTAETWKVVSSVGATRASGGRDAGTWRARSRATVVVTALKVTWAASASVSVFTGHRSVPQCEPQVIWAVAFMDRYNIVNEQDLRDGVTRLAALHAGRTEAGRGTAGRRAAEGGRRSTASIP